MNRPNLIVRDFEIGECTYDVLMKELKKPFNGRAYHTTDTNQFFYDWNGKRYELNWLGKSATVEEKDIAELKKQIKAIQDGNKANSKDIAALKTTVAGIKGITKEQEDALNSISDIDSKVEAATQAAENATYAAKNAQKVAEELEGKLDSFAKKEHNHDDVYSKLNHTHDQYLTEHQSLDGYATEEWVNDKGYLTEHQSLEDYATKEDLNGKANANHTHSEYLTEHQSLEGYVTEDNMKDILKDYLTGSEGIDVSELADALKDYLTGSDIADFVTTKDLEDALKEYLTSSDAADLVNKDVLNGILQDYLTSSEGIDKEELKAALADYLTSSEGIDKGELEAVLKDYLTSSEADSVYATKDVVKRMIEESLGGSDEPIVIPTYIGSKYVNIDGAGSENVNVVEVKLGDNKFIQNIVEINNDTYIGDSDEANGLVTMSQVIELIKKKSNEEVETVDYLYTNGYKLNDTKIYLNQSNQYVIEMNDKGEFVIEMLHSNETDGYYDEIDPSGNYSGEFFYVMIPNDYEIKNYLWDPATQDYKKDDTSVTDKSFTLIPYTVTPTSKIYYYKDATDRLLVEGAKTHIEEVISQTYNDHLIKIVITKKEINKL